MRYGCAIRLWTGLVEEKAKPSGAACRSQGPGLGGARHADAHARAGLSCAKARPSEPRNQPNLDRPSARLPVCQLLGPPTTTTVAASNDTPTLAPRPASYRQLPPATARAALGARPARRHMAGQLASLPAPRVRPTRYTWHPRPWIGHRRQRW